MELEFPQTLDVKIFEFDSKIYLLDLRTSCFIEIDEITCDMIKRAGRMETKALVSFLSWKYGIDETLEVLREFHRFKDRGILLSIEEKKNQKFTPPGMYYVTSFSVNLTHNCNLRCKYCYAGEGNYGLPRDYMTMSVAEDVADTLVKSSGPKDNISVLFFGGEPLLNFEVLKYFVLYLNKVSKDKNKKVDYTVITNGTLLTDRVIEFLNNYNLGVQVSLDGEKKIQDFLRPMPEGRGSYEVIEKKVRKLTSSRRRGSVRATVNHYNTDLVNITRHLLELGFTHIHLEPVTADEKSELYINQSDLKKLKAEYEKLADFYYKELKNGHYFGIEGFTNAMSFTYNCDRKIYGCGAGRTFMAVTPKGDIYPCHRFQGMKEWKMGSIYSGVDDDMRKIFLNTFAENINECSHCWARYYCGGGCIVESLIYNKDLHKPPSWHCELRRLELKLGLQIYSSLSREEKHLLERLYG